MTVDIPTTIPSEREWTEEERDEFYARKYKAMVFTLGELEILDAALKVISGGGFYAMLRSPHIVAAHQDLYHKFHAALTALTGKEEPQGGE